MHFAMSTEVRLSIIAIRSVSAIGSRVLVGVELYVENVSASVFARHVRRNHSAAYDSYQGNAAKAIGEQMV